MVDFFPLLPSQHLSLFLHLVTSLVPRLPTAARDEGIWFPHPPHPHHVWQGPSGGQRGQDQGSPSSHSIFWALESQKVNSSSQGKVPCHPLPIRPLPHHSSQAKQSCAEPARAMHTAGLSFPPQAMHSCGCPPLQPEPCWGNVPLYPWAAFCFSGMLAELKEQDHGNPMTGGLGVTWPGPPLGSPSPLGWAGFWRAPPPGISPSLPALPDLSHSTLHTTASAPSITCSPAHSWPQSPSLTSSLSFCRSCSSTTVFTEHWVEREVPDGSDGGRGECHVT